MSNISSRKEWIRKLRRIVDREGEEKERMIVQEPSQNKMQKNKNKNPKPLFCAAKSISFMVVEREDEIVQMLLWINPEIFSCSLNVE